MALSVVAAYAPISRISISVAEGAEMVAVEEERPGRASGVRSLGVQGCAAPGFIPRT